MMLRFQNLSRDETPDTQTKRLGPGGVKEPQVTAPLAAAPRAGATGASEGGAAAVTASHWSLWSKVGGCSWVRLSVSSAGGPVGI